MPAITALYLWAWEVTNCRLWSSCPNMLAAKSLRLLVGACFATCVAAVAGDDFSNNLFTDLTPYVPQPCPALSVY